MNKADLIQKRAEAVAAMRALVNTADAAKRKMSVEEDAKFAEIDADIESYSAQITKMDKLEANEERESFLSRTTAPARPDFSASPEDLEKAKALAYEKAFKEYTHLGANQALSAESERILRAAITDNPQTETTTGGGYLIPTGFSNQLEEALKMYGGMLDACEVFDTATGNPLPWPTVNDTTNSGRILAINTQVQNTAFTFGQVNFGAFTFVSDQVLVPIQLMQDSYFNLDSFVAKGLGTRLGRILNNKLTVGNNSGEPNGIVTAATLGKTGASGQTATIIYEDFVDLEHSVDPAYRKSASAGWMMSDAMLKLIKKLKDSNGRPLWQPGLTATFARGAQNSILDYPYHINQDMAAPGTSGSPVVGNKSLLFGDLSKYKIRRVAGGTTVLRLVERYADYLQVGFIGYLRADGQLEDAGTNPIKYYQNAAS